METFRFDDPAGLVAWQTRDRGVVDLPDTAVLEERRDALVDLVRRWVRA